MYCRTTTTMVHFTHWTRHKSRKFSHMKIKKPLVHFIIKIIFIEKMNVRHSMGALHSFSIKNIFHNEIGFLVSCNGFFDKPE